MNTDRMLVIILTLACLVYALSALAWLSVGAAIVMLLILAMVAAGIVMRILK